LIALADQYKNDPETLAQQEEIKRAGFDQAKDALYSSFSTTAEEYVMYMGKNGQEVNKYLDTNPDIKQQIDTLSARVNALLEEYESLKGSKGEPPAPPLP
jgi:chromosome segregation ATPase